jgi:hypothetical protein
VALVRERTEFYNCLLNFCIKINTNLDVFLKKYSLMPLQNKLKFRLKIYLFLSLETFCALQEEPVMCSIYTLVKLRIPNSSRNV